MSELETVTLYSKSGEPAVVNAADVPEWLARGYSESAPKAKATKRAPVESEG